MSKIAQYLQGHLEGEVSDQLEVRRRYATDASVLKLEPTIVAMPRNEEDVRKICRFTYQLAERGHKLPVTARGDGGNTVGNAIGKGILAIFGPHLNRIIELNPRRNYVTVESGLSSDVLHQTLVTHGLWLPATGSPGSATLGGLLAENSSGSHSLKYGCLDKYVERLRVVLANGEVMEVQPLDKRELSHKMGLSTLEGEIYRELDTLLEENSELIGQAREKFGSLPVQPGYKLWDISKDGRFNLLPLLVGSEGTLAITSEATLRLSPHNPSSSLVAISLGRLSSLAKLLPEIVKLNPSVCSLIGQEAVEEASKSAPGFFDDDFPLSDKAFHLLVEFDDSKDNVRKSLVEKLAELATEAGGQIFTASAPEDYDRLRRPFELGRAMNLGGKERARPLPIIAASLPPEELAGYLEKMQPNLKAAGLPFVLRVEAGGAKVFIEPSLDLSQVGDRQKIFKLTNSSAKAAGESSGSIGLAGRWQADKLELFYGKKLYGLMAEVKKIFDPFEILNPGVKLGINERDIKMMMAAKYNPPQVYS